MFLLFQLLSALKEQQEANAKLRDYMDRLMLRIMEKNPALLEIDKMEKNKKKKWATVMLKPQARRFWAKVSSIKIYPF